jgi:hypothetical protein
MPIWSEPESRMPTDRTPTPAEFVQEATRRWTYDPRAHAIGTMVGQIVESVRGRAPDDTELIEHLRMGALLALVVDEHLDAMQERAAHIEPPAWATDPKLTAVTPEVLRDLMAGRDLDIDGQRWEP